MAKNLRVSYHLLVTFSLILTAYGLIILYSTSQALNNGMSLFCKQCVWLGISLVAFWVCAHINLIKLKPFSNWIGGLTLVVLSLVLIPGVSRSVKGAHRWLEFGGLRIQPSEPAKIGFIIFFSYFLTHYMNQMEDVLKGFLRPLMMVGMFCLLLILEPDFGTTALFGTVAAILLFIRGVKLKFIIPATILCLILFSLAIFFNPVRMNRIIAFLDLENNRLTGAYQLWQSLIAFSSGGWLGKGLGQGRQQFFFLPEAHTDFIGAILGEELGVLQMLLVLACFGFICFHSFRIIRQLGDPFLFYLGLGAISFLTAQVFINLGVITGLLPTKGIALPFLSYGGSNLLTSFCLLGFIVNLSRTIYSPINFIRSSS